MKTHTQSNPYTKQFFNRIKFREISASVIIYDLLIEMNNQVNYFEIHNNSELGTNSLPNRNIYNSYFHKRPIHPGT